MIEVIAPNEVRMPKKTVKMPTVFLGGGITGTKNWQKEIVNLLKDDRIVIYNPRREKFDIKDKENTVEQIKWEFNQLWKADVITFWFCNNQIQPIVLLELGSRLGQYKIANANKTLNSEIKKIMPLPKVIIGIEEGYEREDDVLLQVECVIGKKPKISRTLEDLANRVRKAAKNIYPKE